MPRMSAQSPSHYFRWIFAWKEHAGAPCFASYNGTFVSVLPAFPPPPIFRWSFCLRTQLGVHFLRTVQRWRTYCLSLQVRWRPWNRDSLSTRWLLLLHGRITTSIVNKYTLTVSNHDETNSYRCRPCRFRLGFCSQQVCVFLLLWIRKKIRVVHGWMMVFCPVFIFRDSN